jgi:hypothetical protein
MELNTSIFTLYCLDPRQYLYLQLLFLGLTERVHASVIVFPEGEFVRIVAVMFSALGKKQILTGGEKNRQGCSAINKFMYYCMHVAETRGS